MKKNDEEMEIFEDEKKILLDHDYDGIRELDNPLPKWWLKTFYLTIIFSIPYYLGHTFFGAQSIEQEYNKDVVAMTKAQEEYDAKKGQFKLEEYTKVISGAKNLKASKKLYKRKCRSCHGADGEGGIGPNLADNFWIHGEGSKADIYNIINKGVVEKGMAAWGPKLGKDKVYSVLSYVMTFKGTKPENAKAPQGQEYK